MLKVILCYIMRSWLAWAKRESISKIKERSERREGRRKGLSEGGRKNRERERKGRKKGGEKKGMDGRREVKDVGDGSGDRHFLLSLMT